MSVRASLAKLCPRERVTAGVVGSLLAMWMSGALAVTVQRASPQGEVAQVRQITVVFSQAVMPLGDLRQPDPFTVNCQGEVPRGQGRWSTDKVWLYDFEEDLGPGVRCSVEPRKAWAPKLEAAGSLQAQAFRFQTGGPAVRQVWPYAGNDIEEDQHFLLMLNGAANVASIERQAYCQAEGVGETLPVKVVTGRVRDDLLKERSIKGVQAERSVLLSCQRPLPNGARVKLVWGKGIAARAVSQVVTTVVQTFDFKVRPAFTAEFTCERERAQSPCLPLRPMTVRFSSPISRKDAGKIRLAPDSGDSVKPFFDKDDRSEEVTDVTFMPPLPESTAMRVKLPDGLRDVTGRKLDNEGAFPLKVGTSAMPPLAKFAAAPFGVIELLAEPGQPPMVPITVRHVEKSLGVKGLDAAAVRAKTIQQDGDILKWMSKVRRFHETSFTARELGYPASQWQEWVTQEDEDGTHHRFQRERLVGSREVSLLNKESSAKTLKVPAADPNDPRPFEVVGIPVDGPGYHVIEVESARLGAALLAHPAPMYVRTGVLVTNMGVHFKLGRSNSLVWVTSLDKGKPVAGADVTVNNCRGTKLWSGKTNEQGLARIDAELAVEHSNCLVSDGLFITARKAVMDGPYKGRTDLAFVFTDWQKGIESWRFNQPTASPSYGGEQDDLRAHTVLDRTLFRAGETVSMKHLIRKETITSLGAWPADQLPDKVRITHVGTGTEYSLPVHWDGGRQALSSWTIPTEAKLGSYDVELEGPGGRHGGRRSYASGSFRVEEFRLPLVDARLSAPKGAQIAPKELALSAQLRYLAGGGVAQTPVQVTAVVRDRLPQFAGYDEFSFAPPRAVRTTSSEDDGEAPQSGGADQVVADKLSAVTDREGAATIRVKALSNSDRPRDMHAEMTFTDPNGEVQTVSTRVPLWPSAVVLGINSTRWAGTGGSNQGKVKFQVLALDVQGKPLASQAVEVQAQLAQTFSTRKRIVGGFYAYDNHTEIKDLGKVCSGKTDNRGMLLCETVLDQAGEVELVAKAKDGDGRLSQAATQVWVTRQGELWFEQDNDDRMDVLPEKRSYEPGETARLQVRMPFREATVLVSVEREGVIDTRVMTLRGDDPVIELPIPRATKGPDGEVRSWAPNVYVSVMALRGRIREVPWYSFFTWGWRSPVEWFKAFWYEGREYQAPTAMVDLSKPAYKIGVAALRIGTAEHALKVEVVPDKSQYAIRQTAHARIKVTQGGQPVQGEFAFAAVDEALLALSSNGSWDVLDAMLQPRPWAVETSTAQNEIVGRRHYGRKAIAAGGGGGMGSSRELFDTLLTWKGSVRLDARGEATVDVPLNDSLTSFRLVAVATSGLSRFGTGAATIRVSQDLQMLPGLPPLVREGDRFEAIFTLRNTTSKPMKVQAMLKGVATPQTGWAGVELSGGPIELAMAPVSVDVPAEGAKEVRWPIDVPAGISSIKWEASAQAAGASDRVKVDQQVRPAVPVRVLQATLSQLVGSQTLQVAPPADGLLDRTPQGLRPRGGVQLGLQPRLTSALPGIRRYFETYPFICLEQKTSKAVGLHDAALWEAVARQLPSYLDADGLASYFPPMAGEGAHGSDYLTAYVLAATHEAGFELPPQARDAMLSGLTAFVQGRIQRSTWSPPGRAQNLMLDVRRLSAIEALSRYGRAEPRMLDAITLAPNTWPTAAVINWYSILQRLPGVADREKRLAQADQILRSRLTFAGTTMKFSTEEDDFWWWLMDNPDANAARLILAVMTQPAWQEDLPRLVVGSLGRQRHGAWMTTNANLWGSLALDKFAARFEKVPVAGASTAILGNTQRTLEWSKSADGGALQLPWPVAAAGAKVPAISGLTVTHQGAGKPWLTTQVLSAVPLKSPLRAGYAVTRSVTIKDGEATVNAGKGPLARGTVLRVRLEVDAQSDMTWVVVSDPVPGGATILGSGLGRDSELATQGERSEGYWPIYVERAFEAYRAYFDYLPKGHHVIEYSVRLNNPGRFNLPPTRVEAMYAPESFAETPNALVEVAP